MSIPLLLTSALASFTPDVWAAPAPAAAVAPPAAIVAAVAAPAERSPVELAVEAGVPAALATELEARATERGLAAADALAPVTEAARDGLPAQAVAAKILEGLAKGVPPDRVRGVARGLLARFGVASALLEEARAAGLAEASAREPALADLAAALGDGVTPDVARGLFGAARRCDAAVVAARTVGDLARRGVPVADALPLARSIAAGAAVAPGEVAALFDAYRREGGKDPRPFLDEAERRARSGASLRGLVDPFGESPQGVVQPPGRGAPPAHEARGRPLGHDPGSVPGLEAGGRGRGKKPKPLK